MLVLLSPAKTMKEVGEFPYPMKAPHFPEETKLIMEHLRTFQPAQLEKAMKVNEKIAAQNYERYKNFLYDEKGSPALLAYTGLQYKNIMADTFSEEEMLFANQCLRIISGLYGVLAPFSSVYPYRLDFEMKLDFPGYANLYSVWNDKIYEFLNKEDDIFVNLASKEYAKTILPYVSVKNTVITCSFYVEKNGKCKMESTAAKTARGLMTAYIVRNRIEEPKRLKEFNVGGFEFQEALSSETDYVFVRRV